MVHWTQEQVIRPLPGADPQTLAWSELQQVKILTTEVDFYFLLEGGGKSLVIAQEEQTGLLERLQELPGFDNDAFIQATMSTSNAEFLCWKR